MITMGTWNVRFAPEAFETEDTEFEWEARRWEISRMISLNKLDILAVQECNQWQLDQINEVTQLEMKPRVAWADCFYPTFFVNPNRVKIERSGDLWLSDSPETPNSKLHDSRWPRMLTWIKAKIEQIDGISLLVNVHMDGEHKQQMKIFNELVSQLITENNPDYIFISGDFNLSLRRFFSDAKGFYKEFMYHSIANTWNAHGRNAEPWDIDWILINKDIKNKYSVEFYKKEARLSINQSDFYISEHDLVLARIKPKSL